MSTKNPFFLMSIRKRLILVGVSALLSLAMVILFFTLRPRRHADIGPNPGSNLIIICIDSLRADHLGCYGYPRNTSPRIDELARSGILFENAFSHSSYTRESVGVLLSGRLPSSNNCTGWLAKPAATGKAPGELFTDAGYQSAFYCANTNLKFETFHKGFQQFHQFGGWGVSRSGPELSDIANRFITSHKNNKILMYLHYLDPHGPYEPPDQYYLKFAPTLYPNPIGLYSHVRMNCAALIKDGFGPGEPRFEDIVLRYDAEIAHTDYAVGMIIDNLEKLNILDNTVIIITADHGEEFLEHRFVEHAWTLYNESTHIPLILWSNKITQPRRITERVSNVHVLPTLLSLLNIPYHPENYDGASLFTRKDRSFYFSPPATPYIGELLIQHRNILRSVVKDNWKYIAAVKWADPDNRPALLTIPIPKFERNEKLHIDTWGPIIHEELYNLSTDPAEQADILHDNTAKRDELRKILDQYQRDCLMKHAAQKKTPSLEKPPTPAEIEKLKSLGYL